ncbi:hypothetical protein IAI10_12165 [Clostridium sp. 19966]|uniref:hypothetical protein n=1 Tax=Clostridium sp. 19966 TaxID=2768166 RepID=UPI0028E07D40|nr:hypothetical protein [Clostridium sp. 19966]MDT8717416.1 hypothetical protein [Clostridium sp. 19966]
MCKEEFVNVLDIAKELNLFVKVVTSVSSFSNYNSFYNIYDENDEPCRRLLVLTPYEDLEEVTDQNPDVPVIDLKLIDGNVWIKDYPLTQNPKNIDFKDIKVSKSILLKVIRDK